MITGVNHVTICVADLDRSLAFYVGRLQFRLRARWARGAYLDAGPLWLCLEISTAPTPARDDSHIAFSGTELDALADLPRWKENRYEGESLYVSDPDGHKLQIHVGDLESRLAACRERPYAEMEFF